MLGTLKSNIALRLLLSLVLYLLHVQLSFYEALELLA